VAGNALTAGLSLRIPDVSRATNSASTYRTYQPSEIIGSTTPQGIDPGPPPPPKAECGAAQIIMIVVAIVVTVYTAGAASAWLANAAPTLFASNAAALAAGTATIATANTAAVVVGGAIAGAAGSMASQTVGIAAGVQDGYDWKAVGMAAVGGAVGGLNPTGAAASDALQAAGRAVASNVITQGIGVMTGLQEKFSWQAVAVSGLAAAVNFGVAQSIKDSAFASTFLDGPKGILTNAAANFVTGTSTQLVRMAVYGQGKLDFASLAADAFGNALGEAVADQMKPKVTSPTAAANAAAKPASVKTFGDQALVEAIDYAPLEKLKLLDLTVEQLPQIESPELATRIAAKGDSWARIAKQVYGDERYALALMQANGTTSTTLRLGQEVVLPDLAGADLKAGGAMISADGRARRQADAEAIYSLTRYSQADRDADPHYVMASRSQQLVSSGMASQLSNTNTVSAGAGWFDTYDGTGATNTNGTYRGNGQPRSIKTGRYAKDALSSNSLRQIFNNSTGGVSTKFEGLKYELSLYSFDNSKLGTALYRSDTSFLGVRDIDRGLGKVEFAATSWNNFEAKAVFNRSIGGEYGNTQGSVFGLKYSGNVGTTADGNFEAVLGVRPSTTGPKFNAYAEGGGAAAFLRGQGELKRDIPLGPLTLTPKLGLEGHLLGLGASIGGGYNSYEIRRLGLCKSGHAVRGRRSG
jgi:hypothetical protein